MTDVGSITVDENGQATGEGFAYALFEGMLAGSVPVNKAAVAAAMVSPMLGLAEAIAGAIHPIGCIISIALAVNPRDLFGFGEWEFFGPGRVLVGYHPDDTDFDSVEETGGSKAHSHDLPFQFDGLLLKRIASFGTGASHAATNIWTGEYTSGTAAVEITDDGSSLPPYIVVYRWKRIA